MGVNEGPGRVLIAIYGLFAVAAGARAGVQIATKFTEAPLAYALSALAALVYVVATVALWRGQRWLAYLCCTLELVGVITIGAASLVAPEAFPHATVWSGFGRGYGFVPLVLPILGLLWLRASTPDRREPRGPASS